MKILIVNTFFYPNEVGGAENSCRVLAEGLIDKGHEVSVLSTTNKKSFTSRLGDVDLFYLKLTNFFWHGENKKQGVLKGIGWHILDMFNPFMFYKVYRLLKKISPDVIHTNNTVGFSSSVWLAAKILGIPIVHTLRDFYLKCYRSSMRKKGHNCEQQCVSCRCLTTPRRLLSSKVQAVVGNSNYMVESHLKSGYFSHVPIRTVIFNAWEPKVLPVPKFKENNLEHNRFGFIGRVTEEKGVELLCDAFKVLCESNKDRQLSLVIAGEGNQDYVAFLKDKYSEVENIRFLGKVNPEAFYQSIDFTVVPSLWEEPLARVVFESFFFGVPVLTTSRGGNAEVIVNGVNGFIFGEDTAALKEVMEKSLIADYSMLSRESYASRVDFLQSSLVSNYINVYDEILNENVR